MQPNFYSDIKIRPDPDIPEWDCLGRVWRSAHCVARSKGILFAIAFPEWMNRGHSMGDCMRLFFDEQAQADAFLDGLESSNNVADYIGSIGRIKTPTEGGDYVAYRMHRLPSGISRAGSISPEVKAELQSKHKARRMVNQRSFLFVRMRSSSGHSFRLVVERVFADPTHQGNPNSYGLSRSSQIIALPVI